MEHAVHPTDFVETEPLKDFSILILYSSSAYRKCKNPHKGLPIRKPGIMFSTEINASYLSSYLLQEAYTYVEDFLGLWEKWKGHALFRRVCNDRTMWNGFKLKKGRFR